MSPPHLNSTCRAEGPNLKSGDGHLALSTSRCTMARVTSTTFCSTIQVVKTSAGSYHAVRKRDALLHL